MMNRHAGYSYPAPAITATAITTTRYSGTSSAFSASANPNEDWTKISDLAERRRIQNRIAQRNYRKKLKKRLEDLERKAASTSPSPEQKPVQLKSPPANSRFYPPSPASTDSDFRRTPEAPGPYSEDRGLFGRQYTDRQLSTSPPPFSYSTYPTPDTTYSLPYSSTASYNSISTTITPSLTTYASYLPPITAAYHPASPGLTPPIKHEYYAEDEIANPFASGYQLMGAGLDLPPAHAYPDAPHTPPLSASLTPSMSGSPPEALYSSRPISLPPSPPLGIHDLLM